jgi:DNA-binding MarR family transcriptional regulator
MQDISFGRYTSILYRNIQIIVNHHLKPFGIGSGQYLFLIAISKHDGINQKDLTAYLNIDKATTAKALAKLEELGYILRLKDAQDRRYYKIHLSKKGNSFMPTLREILNKTTITLSKDMTSEDQEKSRELFELMIKNALREVSNLK